MRINQPLPSAGVVLHELVDGIGLQVGVHEHPEEVIEEHHLAADHCAGASAAVRVCVTLGDDLEERVVDHPVTLLVAAVHGGRPARSVARGASGGETVMRGVRPVLEHVLELPETPRTGGGVVAMATSQKSSHFRDAFYFIGVCGAGEFIAILLLLTMVAIRSPHLRVAFLSSPGYKS
ncbi:hypothetical protein BHM03_00052029 [Ensete ventricosum]|nr:hypothetical protein BHM03_00052029 [Ensete ventricosum]